MTGFADIMRRIVTGDDASGKSVVIVDGPPSSVSGAPDVGGLFDIWQDLATGPLDAREHADLGPRQAILSPKPGHVKVRWFVVPPLDPDIPDADQIVHARQRFAAFGAEDHLRDQSLHPAMHQTDTLDVICLLSGDASLVLDTGETRIKPGQIVIQRGTSHAWRAHGSPALLLAVLIDRPLAGSPHAATSG